MITITMHGDRTGLRNGAPLDQLESLAHQSGTIIWVDVEDPTPADIDRLAATFTLHPLALEDSSRFRQRAKLDQYETFLFIVFFALSWPEGAGPQAQELHLFVGEAFLITIHHGPVPAIAATADRWCRPGAWAAGEPRIGLLVYALLDAIVDDYFPVIDTLAERVDDLDQRVFSSTEPQIQADIFALKKDLLAIRRVVAPERDVMNILVRRDTPIFTTREEIYFQDVYDHVLRVTDAIDLYRDLLSSALEVSTAVIGNRLNQIMRTLTASSIILMSIAVVAGVYGMNFDYMPELHWAYGYPFALGLMVLVGGTIFLLFRRSNWL